MRRIFEKEGGSLLDLSGALSDALTNLYICKEGVIWKAETAGDLDFRSNINRLKAKGIVIDGPTRCDAIGLAASDESYNCYRLMTKVRVLEVYQS
jgi:hypothetical protein